ncbi:DUF6292 family protein [Amycolatopsis sp. NPDC059021]|uniref:DUF6292 family protein n=1 Tax=Amycolatopsis sp. NPDC059021 TaxID=3346704 RepID=UPI003671EFD0
MTAAISFPAAQQHHATRSLRGYLAEVACLLGIGLESCVIDHDRPVSAYLALDIRLPQYPDRDVALLWDECRGWSIAIETHSGEDLIVLRYLGGSTPVPGPRRVARFVEAMRAGDHRPGRPDPVSLREAGDLDDLAALLARPRS